MSLSKYIIADEWQVCNLDTIENTGEILEDQSASGRARPWKEHKMDNTKLYKLFERARNIDQAVMSDSRMDSLKDCAAWLQFLEDSEGNRKLHKANFCRVRTCPMCNWRRSMKLFSQVSSITDAIMSDKPDARFIFVTLTIKNVAGKDLPKTLDSMNQAFQYIAAKSRTFAPAKAFKAQLMGYMKAVEINWNHKTNDFHPHIHCIFEVMPGYFDKLNYLTNAEWRQLWADAMHLDYLPMTNVKVVKSTANAVAEVSKYPVKIKGLLESKETDRTAQALIDFTYAMKNRRLITFGGDFKTYKAQLKLDDVEDGDLTHVEADEEKGFNPIARVLFKYRADVGAYIC